MIPHPNVLRHHRDLALAAPCARAVETLDPDFAFLFVERARRWSAILTVNR